MFYNIFLRSYHSEKIGRPVDSADLKEGKGHVEGDKEEVRDTEDQDEDILRCQHHLNSMIELFKQNIMQFFVLWAKLLGMPLQRRLLWVIGDSPPHYTTIHWFRNLPNFLCPP